MNSTIFFSICSLFYCVLLFIIAKLNKKQNATKEKVMKCLIILNFVGLLLESCGIFLGTRYTDYELLNKVVLKSMLLYHMIWATMFIVYTIVVSSKNEVINKKTFVGIILIMSICCVINLFLPLQCKMNDGVVMYTYGNAVDFVYFYSLACDILCLFTMFKNSKNIRKSKYAPLFVLISFGTIITILQSSYPELLLSTSMHTFVTYIIYFTMDDKKVSA
jgi:hypothetical protein